MQEVAEKVAARVAEAHDQVQFHSWVELDAALTRLPLQVRRPTEAMLQHFAALEAGPASEGSRHRREAIYAERIALLADAPEIVEVPLQSLRIGDLAIAAIPFETFAETGLAIKQQSPAGQTFTIELANGSYGYLPTPEQHRLGGYETWLGTNYVEEQASEKIRATLMQQMGQLFSPDDAAKPLISEE